MKLSAMAVKDVQGKAIMFYSPYRPLKRCLAFQAQQAVQQARSKGWPVDDLRYWDFSSPGFPRATLGRVKDWVQSLEPGEKRVLPLRQLGLFLFLLHDKAASEATAARQAHSSNRQHQAVKA